MLLSSLETAALRDFSAQTSVPCTKNDLKKRKYPVRKYVDDVMSENGLIVQIATRYNQDMRKSISEYTSNLEVDGSPGITQVS